MSRTAVAEEEMTADQRREAKNRAKREARAAQRQVAAESADAASETQEPITDNDTLVADTGPQEESVTGDAGMGQEEVEEDIEEDGDIEEDIEEDTRIVAESGPDVYSRPNLYVLDESAELSPVLYAFGMVDRLENISLNLISTGNNPRKHFDEISLVELADSIRNRGVIEPIIVRNQDGKFTIVAGERRYRAAIMEGLTKIPAIIKHIESETEAMTLALIENLQRRDLNAVEEACGYRSLIDMGVTQAEICIQVNRSPEAVSNALRLLKLPDWVLKKVQAGGVSKSHARALISIAEDEANLRSFVDMIESEGVTSTRLEALVTQVRDALTQQAVDASRQTSIIIDGDIAGPPATVEQEARFEEGVTAAPATTTPNTNPAALPRSVPPPGTLPAARGNAVLTDVADVPDTPDSAQDLRDAQTDMVQLAMPRLLDEWLFEGGYQGVRAGVIALQGFVIEGARRGFASGQEFLAALKGEDLTDEVTE